jgi:hypothetical protein
VDDFSYETAALVFATYFAIDVLYARFYIEVSKKRPFRAAVLSSLLYSLLAYGVITYSHNPVYLAPLVCGAFLGTFVTVRFQK